VSRVIRAVVVVLASTALALGACGGGGDGRFEADGFAITFEYPDDFEESDDVTISEQRGSRAEESRAVGLDEDNGIIVQRYALERSINQDNLNLAKAEFDALVEALSPDAAKGKATEIAGLPALRYPNVPVRTIEDGRSRLIVLFDGRTEYLINCQSTPDKRAEVEEACDMALNTLRQA
jgi:hypothetical protein